MIQITSLEKSIWRGEVWSNLSFKIKAKNLVHSPKKGVPFTLHPSMDYDRTRLIYEYDCNKAKLQFARKIVIGCDGLSALVTMDPYNSTKANINKDLVVSRGTFMLVIYAQYEDHYENEYTIMERSQKI